MNNFTKIEQIKKMLKVLLQKFEKNIENLWQKFEIIFKTFIKIFLQIFF